MTEPVRAESCRDFGELCQHIVRLLAAADGKIRRIRLHAGDVGVELEWPDTRPVGATATVLAERHLGPDIDVEGEHRVRAPMVGTFYRAPAPGASPFVQEGSRVEPGQQIGIIEAMKLMNPIEANRPGIVRQILVADAEPVEYDQPLIVLEEEEVS